MSESHVNTIILEGAPAKAIDQLTAFLQTEAVDPAGQFSGSVNEDWAIVRQRGTRFPDFTYRGQIVAASHGEHALVTFHVTPTLLTAIVLLPVGVVLFLAIVFLLMFAAYLPVASVLGKAATVVIVIVCAYLFRAILRCATRTIDLLRHRLQLRGFALPSS